VSSDGAAEIQRNGASCQEVSSHASQCDAGRQQFARPVLGARWRKLDP
jgi:hypothetical protein